MLRTYSCPHAPCKWFFIGASQLLEASSGKVKISDPRGNLTLFAGRREKLTRDVAGHRLVVESGKLAGKQGVLREFSGQVGELRSGDIFLFFAERGQRQQDFLVGAQIVSLLR